MAQDVLAVGRAGFDYVLGHKYVSDDVENISGLRRIFSLRIG
jgi:hypothetical protein